MLSDVVGERISAWRKRRGWNRERLAEECARLGMPKVTAESITNIESGRRKDGVRRRMITIDEVVVISAALCVPFDVLIIPYPDQETMSLLPSAPVSTVDALTWFEGEGRLSDIAKPDEEGREFWQTARTPRALLRAHANNLREWYRQLKVFASMPDDDMDMLRARMEASSAEAMAARERFEIAQKAEFDARHAGDDAAVKDAAAQIGVARRAYEDTRMAQAAAREQYAARREVRDAAQHEMRRIELVILRIRETFRRAGYPLPDLPEEAAHLADRKSNDYDGGDWSRHLDDALPYEGLGE